MKTRTIAAFLSTLTSAYHKEILQGASDCALSNKYNFIAYSGQSLNRNDNDSQLRTEIFNFINPDLVDGIIIAISALSRFSTKEQFDVFMNHYREYKITTIGGAHGDFPSILPDYEGGMIKLIDHLVEIHGCKRILFIRGLQLSYTSNIREEAYKKALKKHNLELDPELILYKEIQSVQGREAVREVLESKIDFDAIITVNDSVAMAVQEELQTQGIDVPGDKIVCGFQGIFEGNTCHPSLTTVNEDAYRQGYMAAQALIDQLEGKKVPKEVTFPIDLLIRQSCGCSNQYITEDSSKANNEIYPPDTHLEEAKQELIEIYKDNSGKITDPEEFVNKINHLYNSLTIDSRNLNDKLIIQLRHITFSITVGEDLSRSIDNIVRLIDLKHCYILRFGYKDDILNVLLERAFVDKEHIDLSEYNRIVPVEKLLPKSLLPKKGAFSLVVEPLSFRGILLGYMVFDNSYRNGTIYEVIQTMISSNLYFDRQFMLIEKARERFSDIALSSSDWLWEVDKDLKFIFSSDGVESVMGYTISEIMGNSLFDHTQDDQEDRIDTIINDYINKQLPFKEIEMVYLHKNNDILWLSISGRPIIYHGKTIGYRGIFRDITERKQLMIEQSRFASVGEMMGIIAHQWRQPLSNISTSSTKMRAFMQLGMNTQETFDKMLEDINRDAQFLSTTIDDFRNFFRKNTLDTACDVNDLMDKTLDILDHSLNYYNIKLTIKYQLETKVIARGNELMQVFLNLIKNAYDVLVSKKVVNPEIIINTYEDQDVVGVSVEDNAGGIDADVIKHIFDPYFTTKGTEKGTGIGLYISRVIIHDHCKGKISVENTTRGAKFMIAIPKGEFSLHP